MGKLSKYSNLYNNSGELLRRAPLKKYSIEELNELIKSLPDGKEKENAISILTQYIMDNWAKSLNNLPRTYAIPPKENEDKTERIGDDERLDEPIQENGEIETESQEDEVQEVSYDVNSFEIEDAKIVED